MFDYQFTKNKHIDWTESLTCDHQVKSPRYTGGVFMFLYQFVRRHLCQYRRRPQILVHAINFEHLFRFFTVLDDWWPCPVDYLIRFWSIFVATLTLNFEVQIWNLLYLNHIWSDCHETKIKHIDWTLGLKCDHWLWPWPWLSPWIFKVKYRICYISAKNGPIATKRKANISIELKASNVTNGFDLNHDLDLWTLRSNVTLTFDHTHDFDHGFSWSNLEIAVSQNRRVDWYCAKGVAVRLSWPWPFGDQGQVYGSTSDQGGFSVWRAVDPSSYFCIIKLFINTKVVGIWTAVWLIDKMTFWELNVEHARPCSKHDIRHYHWWVTIYLTLQKRDWTWFVEMNPGVNMDKKPGGYF